MSDDERRYAVRYVVCIKHGKTTLDDHEQELHGHVIAQTAQIFVTSFPSRCLNSEHAHASSVSPLDVMLVLPRYKYSHKWLLLIDFEGTLYHAPGCRSHHLRPQTRLNRLLEDWRNEVWLLSGLPVVGKMEVVAGELRNVGIV
jgi:trehalose 6-phosphate synthase complex regulatory subunit